MKLVFAKPQDFFISIHAERPSLCGEIVQVFQNSRPVLETGQLI